MEDKVGANKIEGPVHRQSNISAVAGCPQLKELHTSLLIRSILSTGDDPTLGQRRAISRATVSELSVTGAQFEDASASL